MLEPDKFKMLTPLQLLDFDDGRTRLLHDDCSTSNGVYYAYGCLWKLLCNVERFVIALITYTQKSLPKSTYPIDIVDYPNVVDLIYSPSRLVHLEQKLLTLCLDSVSQISRLDFLPSRLTDTLVD